MLCAPDRCNTCVPSDMKYMPKKIKIVVFFQEVIVVRCLQVTDSLAPRRRRRVGRSNSECPPVISVGEDTIIILVVNGVSAAAQEQLRTAGFIVLRKAIKVSVIRAKR